MCPSRRRNLAIDIDHHASANFAVGHTQGIGDDFRQPDLNRHPFNPGYFRILRNELQVVDGMR